MDTELLCGRKVLKATAETANKNKRLTSTQTILGAKIFVKAIELLEETPGPDGRVDHQRLRAQ